MSLLSAGEVIQFAVRIEENGYNFYATVTEKVREEKEREVFRFLADEEKKHLKTFTGMLEKIETFEPPTSYPDEYFAYLRAYAENLIFTKDSLDREIENVRDARGACDFGMKRELDSILYYQEIKPFVPEKERNLIDTIVTEERKHFLALSDLKKKL
jgi:rubrerythrin